MKTCPKCSRNYSDETLNFCLEDGEWLVASDDRHEPSTAILPDVAVPGENETRQQILTTGRTAEFDSRISDQSKSNSFDRRLLFAPLVVALIVLTGYAGYRYLSASGDNQIGSIAVLPFENRSGNTDSDYLSDGLTDSLIFRFSQLPNLKVSPTSSVMRYKGKETEVSEIAKVLDVDAVLSGRLQQVGESLNISVQLIDARSGKLVWAEQYDRKMADLLATQREIATTLTQKMQLKLATDERGITKKYTSSNEAYQLYMKGRYHYAKRAKDDMLKAIESYDQAIALDSSFALAYAAKAEAYNSMGKNPDLPPKDCIPLAKAAAQKALEIDPDLAQAHSALGDSLAIYDWNWIESERHFKRAIELEPNIAYLHLVYGASYLSAMGKAEEAMRQTERAVELEPLSLIANSILVTGYINNRQFDKAVEQGRKAVDLDPAFPLTKHWLGMALIAIGRYDEAIQLCQVPKHNSLSEWLCVVTLGHAFAKNGKRAEAEQQIAILRNIEKEQYVRPFYLASIYASLGDKDKAFAELERSFEQHDCYLARAAVDPFLDPLRDDPRFKDLLKRMNLTH